MYKYAWDEETGGVLLIPEIEKMSLEPRPVYYRELDILGFDKYWKYPKDDSAPLMWATANKYIYRGRLVATTKGGALYTPPELHILDEPEPNGESLRFVDVERMVAKNAELMETLAQETIQKIYNTFVEYKEKVDIFYVAFSGGKDSVVTLDLVQKALPHDEFMVLFGDTGMEFPDTYSTVAEIKKRCDEENICFYISKSHLLPEKTWNLFGPPATVSRWCCSVHKTSPQILLLRKVLGRTHFKGMAYVGVRSDESLARSKYEYITYAGKHQGQYSCNPILTWSSSEVFLHMYKNCLPLNEAYKKGNRRAGCLICPRAAERNDFMNHYCYENEAEKFVSIIRNLYRESFGDQEALETFIRTGGWKARKNGRDISIPVNYREYLQKSVTRIVVDNPRSDWREWIKTIGDVTFEKSSFHVKFQGNLLSLEVEEKENGYVLFINQTMNREFPAFVKALKNVFRRAACCVQCRECEANCPYGYISFDDGRVKVDEKCRHCLRCHEIEKGCLVYKSLEMPKGGITMGGKTASLNTYSHHAPRMDWIKQYFELKNDFDSNHNLGSQMFSFFKRFLRDAKLLDSDGFSSFARLVEKIGINSQSSWGIIFTNLCYSPQVNWFVKKLDFNETYTKGYIASLLMDDGAKETWTNDIINSLGRLVELPLGEIGLGCAEREKARIVAVVRYPWNNPDPRVILYALYKFAEACGNMHQFTLSTLLDDTIERDGVSPTRIFGLNQETMIPLLNGLSTNYPEFISASFNLGMDEISLRPEKTAENVLELF